MTSLGFRKPFATLAVGATTFVVAIAAAAGQPLSVYTQPQPVRPNVPGTPSDEIGLTAAAPLLREGSFVASSRGQAIKGKTGRWFFVFDPDAQGRTLPPMVLLPNLNLAAVERSVDRNPPGTRLVVTGITTVYQNHNYLLLSAPPLLVRAEAAPAVDTPAPSPTADGAPPTATDAKSTVTGMPARATAGEPSIDEIVTTLDRAAGKIASLAPQRSTGSTAPSTGTQPTPPTSAEPTPGPDRGLLAPGLLASRRGRIFRTPDGALVFSIDSGLEGASAVAPLILLPSQNLAALEQIAERAGESATYTMSGEIATYRGQNYLLPRSYQANRATDQILPAQ